MLRKKMVRLVLAFFMVFSMIPATSVTAAEEFLIKNGVLIRYDGTGGAVTIPNGVTSIEEGAFYQCTGLTSVTIPNGVSSIGSLAFLGCTGLTSVTLPDSLTSLGGGAFEGCTGLTSVTLPDSLTSLGGGAFKDCTGLTSISIPNGVTKIGGWAFTGCGNLTTVVIPESVTSIVDYEFLGCEDLTIYGVAGSYAEKFAQRSSIKFSTSTPPTSVSTQPTTPPPTQPTAPPKTQSALTAVPTASKVLVNGNPVDFDAYNIDGSNYFKLRDLSYTLNGTEKQFDVSWDNAANAINLLSNETYIVAGGEMVKGDGMIKDAVLTTSTILLNGEEIKLTAYNIGGNNYFKLRDIGKVFNFATDWDGVNNAIKIDTSKPYTE